jgi:Zn-dependent protease
VKSGPVVWSNTALAESSFAMSDLIVPFRVHLTGWLIIASCALLEIFHYGLWWGLAAAILLVASLLLHEVGHMLMAAALGVSVSEFGICLLGAYNRRARANSRRDEVLISLAGPLMNFALIAPCFFLPHIGFELTMGNLVLAVFNLLPIPTSDGLRILKTIWGPFPVASPVRAIPVTGQPEPALRRAA